MSMKRRFIVEHISYSNGKLNSEYIDQITLDTKTDDVYNSDSILVQRAMSVLYGSRRSLYDWCSDAGDLIDRLEGFNTHNDYAFDRIINFIKRHNVRMFVQYKSGENIYKKFDAGLGARGFVNVIGWALINVYEIEPEMDEDNCDKLDILIHEIRELKKEVVRNRKEMSDIKDKVCDIISRV